MNFYPFHIGDYISHTGHLEPMEDLAYRRMIDLYYLRESPLPADPAEVAKLIRMRSDVDLVNRVLEEFFTPSEEGWINGRCDYEICESQSKRSKAKTSAAKRWESEGNANAMPTHSEGSATNTITNTITNTKEESKPIVGYPDEFVAAWNAYPYRPGASKKDAFKAWSARIKDGVDPPAIFDGVVRYSAYCLAAGTEARFVKQPSTFFGPGDHYLADWSVPAARASPHRSIHEQRAETIAVLTGQKNVHTDRERDITGEARRIA